MSLNMALSSALSGLQTNQKGLDLVSRNIANVNTPGYTKKIFNQESRVLNGGGAGVQVTEISRRVDYGLIQELNSETAQLEELQVSAQYFERMQYLFGKPSDNNAIAHMLEDLAGEVEILALDPEKSEQHMAVVQRAEDVALKLNSMSDQLQELRLDADKEIERTVDRVNELLHNIHDLNEEIAYSETTGSDSTDLKDALDSSLAELESLMDVTSFTRTSGEVTVYTRKGEILVDREVKELSHSALSQYSAWTTKGGDDVISIKVNNNDITEEIGSGKLAALVEMRDATLPNYQAQLDNLTAKLRDTINTVNNRGTSFPNLANEYVGTRTFLDSTSQTIQFSAQSDTVVALFDSNGEQVAQTTMRALVDSESGGADDLTTATPLYAAGAPATGVIAHLESWLQTHVGTATATINSDGVLDIKLNSNDFGLAFKDVNVANDPADPPATPSLWTTADASISYDADADGTADITHAGFASFFGLNDLYTKSDRPESTWDSGIKSESWRPFQAGTLNFSDSTTLIRGSLALTGNETLQEIADLINEDTAPGGLAEFLEAEIVPEGEGVRLRIKHTDNDDLVITQAGATALVNALGMKASEAGASNSIAVKTEISDNPSLISRGAMIFNPDTNEYELSAGDNSTANAMAAALSANTTFESAGGLTQTTVTITDYAGLTLSLNARQASDIETRMDYQISLVDKLTLKNAEISAVNLDEEMAELIIFEQSYSASAKVIATVSDMFDILNSIV